MAIFGLGTLPALLILGLTTHLISDSFRRRVFKFAAILVILFGLWTVWKGTMKLTGHMPAHHGHMSVVVSD